MKWLLLFLAPLTAFGGTVLLAWDASTTPGVTNYVLYAHTNTLSKTNLAAARVKLNVGTNRTARLESITPGRWDFAASAVMDGAESDISQVASMEVPIAPPNMRTVVLQYSGTVTGGFYDAGFFKLRFP